MTRGNAPLILLLGLFAAACLMSGVSPAIAEVSEREDRWQFYIPLSYLGSEHFDGEGGSSVNLGSDIGWGFAFGYNFTERWMIGFEVTWARQDYTARIIADDGSMTPTDFRSRLDSSTLAVVGQFNFLETMWTPFIRAGVGSTFLDSNVASGPPTGSCWWHPWWGYICGSWQPTYNATSFSYQAGVGVRGDINDTFFLELIYNSLWIDLSHGTTPQVTGPRLNIGWLF